MTNSTTSQKTSGHFSARLSGFIPCSSGWTGLKVCNASAGALVFLLSVLFSFHQIRCQWACREASGIQSALSTLILSDKADGQVQGRHMKYELSVMPQQNYGTQTLHEDLVINACKQGYLYFLLYLQLNQIHTNKSLIFLCFTHLPTIWHKYANQAQCGSSQVQTCPHTVLTQRTSTEKQMAICIIFFYTIGTQRMWQRYAQ